jgi:hypothetical protein
MFNVTDSALLNFCVIWAVKINIILRAGALFSGLKRPVSEGEYLPPYGAEVKRMELYLYSLIRLC